MNHAKPSIKRRNRNLAMLVITECVLLLFWLGIMASQYWYWPVKFDTYLWPAHLAADAIDIVLTALWLAVAIFAGICTIKDTPTSEDGAAIYDATHDQCLQRLKLGDDLLQVLATKGRSATGGSVLTTIYNDASAVVGDKEANPVQPAPQAAAQSVPPQEKGNANG